VDNQHRQIKGYKDLDQSTIDKMNRVKEMAANVGALIDELKDDLAIDPRWLAIGRTNLQQGFMDVTRSITKPDFF
jgi:hypothetical protein